MCLATKSPAFVCSGAPHCGDPPWSGLPPARQPTGAGSVVAMAELVFTGASGTPRVWADNVFSSSTFDAAQAFDGNNSTFFNSSTLPCGVYAEYSSDQNVTGVSITTRGGRPHLSQVIRRTSSLPTMSRKVMAPSFGMRTLTSFWCRKSTQLQGRGDTTSSRPIASYSSAAPSDLVAQKLVQKF